MEKSQKSTTPSKIPTKASGIPRPRSKSGDRTAGTRSKSFSETRSKSAPRETSDMSARRYHEQASSQENDDDRQNHRYDSQVPQDNVRESPRYDANNYSNLPNNIPRYQGVISSKVRQGILTSQQVPQVCGNSKSAFSGMFRNGAPKDFRSLIGGGHMMKEMDQPPLEDIASMFQRPNTVIPSLRYPSALPSMTSPSGGWGRAEGSPSNEHSMISGYGKDPGWSNPAGVKELQPIMSPNNNSTVGFKNSYSTAEELDNILAKYKNLPQQQQQIPPREQQSYQIYQAMIHTNYPHHLEDSQKGNTTEGGHYSRENHEKKSSKQFDLIAKHRTESNHHPKDNLGVFGLPLDSHKQQKLNSLKDESSNKTGKGHHPQTKHTNHNHRFPFRETLDGDLLVHRDQVAFESKTVSVLISDPDKIWTGRTEKIHDPRHQEQLINEVEEVIHKGLNRYYDIESYPLETEHGKQRAVENEYLEKEVVIMKYSDAKTGTEKLMSDIHHRLRSGRHADTHVVIGEKVYPCHSVALEVVSKFFDNLTRPKETLRRVELPESEVPSTVFPTLMDWIFQNDHGRSVVMNKGNVVPLFSCGKYLDISELKSQCVNYLQEKVETNDRHLMTLWEEVKKRPNCQELMVVISAKAALSFQHIFKEKKFLNLDVGELVMLLSSDDIVIESELDVFDTAVQWLLHNWEGRKVVTNEVIHTVRFGLLTPLQLTQIAHSPELAKGTTVPHEYPELLAYGSVKAMIDDGLAYSIVFESYKAQPEEIRKWVDSTGIKAPRQRNHTSPTGRGKTFVIPHDINATGKKINGGLDLRPSYTVLTTDHHLLDNTLSTTNASSSPRPNKRSEIFENSVSESERRERHRSGETKMESVAESLGRPIKDEDIQSFSPSTMGRPRSSSRDHDYKYHEYKI